MRWRGVGGEGGVRWRGVGGEGGVRWRGRGVGGGRGLWCDFGKLVAGVAWVFKVAFFRCGVCVAICSV